VPKPHDTSIFVTWGHAPDTCAHIMTREYQCRAQTRVKEARRNINCGYTSRTHTQLGDKRGVKKQGRSLWQSGRCEYARRIFSARCMDPMPHMPPHNYGVAGWHDMRKLARPIISHALAHRYVKRREYGQVAQEYSAKDACSKPWVSNVVSIIEHA